MKSSSLAADKPMDPPTKPVEGLVSVIIPAYNQSHFLSKSIKSVLDQTYREFELIVVDDGSTDDTRRVALSFQHPDIQYLYQENAGLSAARNTGVRNSCGEFLTYLDSDDLFAPKKLEFLVEKLKGNPELGFVAGQAILIDENDQPLDNLFDTPPPDEPSDLLYWNPFHVCSTMVRQTWQDRAGPFDESLRAYEDWDMWLRLALIGCKMGWVAEPVSLYRFHTAQMTQDRERMTTATFAVLSKIFADPSLPDTWRKKKDLAYSNAYLRSAIQAYRTEEFGEASSALAQAVQLDPRLAANRGGLLAHRFSALADSPKAKDKLDFLARIYDKLPAELDELAQDRNIHLARAAVELGFDRYQKNDPAGAAANLKAAVRYKPSWLANRGVLSILLKTSLLKRHQSKPDSAGRSRQPVANRK